MTPRGLLALSLFASAIACGGKEAQNVAVVRVGTLACDAPDAGDGSSGDGAAEDGEPTDAPPGG